MYGPLSPKQKYVRYDTTNHKSVYEDDIDDYVSNSEIIIGKNINNIRNRNEITLLEKKYSKYIPIELLVLLVISILIVLIGNAMGPVY